MLAPPNSAFGTLQHTHPDCRWLNLQKLSKRLVNPKSEDIRNVYYFSALTTWLPERAKKHLLYIHALRTVGVKDILGKFSIRERKCPQCSSRYLAHEEKKTDINIAVNLICDAVADEFDTALILSGDNQIKITLPYQKNRYNRAKRPICNAPKTKRRFLQNDTDKRLKKISLALAGHL